MIRKQTSLALGQTSLRRGQTSVSSLAKGGAPAFSPANLFLSGEQGVFYDPSDLSTLFQDTAGTQPVTAAGQSVGLMLDKSKQLVLGPELVSNGAFGTDSGWTKGAGWTISGGVASFNGTVGAAMTQPISFPAGKTYLIQFDLNYTSGSGCIVQISGSGADGATTFNTSGRKTMRITATANRVNLQFTGYGLSVFSIDNVSVRELSGNHATQANAASRPLYQVDGAGRGYLLFDGVDDSLATGIIDFTNTDKMTVVAGVRKLSDAATAILLAYGTSGVRVPLTIYAPANAGGISYRLASAGSSPANADTGSNFPAPISSVVTGVGDISGDVARLRINGAQQAQSSADQGTGNYGSYPLYLGRTSDGPLPFNGRLYSLIVRGAATDLALIEQTEAWVNTKTGAY